MVDYYIDNYNFKGFGIYVQESTGVVDLPKFKPPTEHDWAEYNGTIVDTEKTPRTEARQIQLKCALSAENQTDFLTKVSAFQSVFMTKGLKRLAIVLTHDVGLFFDVYMSDGLQITKRWRDSQMVGQFTVTLTEPEPRKKIIRYDSQDSTPFAISFKNTEAVSVYWGDGEYSQDLYGDVSLSHTYDEPGIYFAIIHGNIEELSEFSTNGEELGANNGGAIDIDVPEILQGALERVDLYTTAESGVTQMTPYLKFSFNNNGETQILRITVTTENDWLAIIRGIERRLTTDEATIANNTEAISKNSEDIADLQGDIEDINSDLQGHNTRITTNANNIQAINNKIGNANGIAELDSSGKVPQSQLPSYVDDVLEYASFSNFPTTGESGKIYVAIDTNKTYRWSGSTYSEISESLALGETSSTAYRGDRGKTAYDHSQTEGNPHNTSKTDVGLGNVANLNQSKAIKSITRSGTTFTATALDGTTSTFTQQDNNTTYDVVSKTANGLCPKLPNETTTTKYLRQDGTWSTPANTDTGATSVEVTGSGNAVTAASYSASNRKITLTKGTTFLTAHQDISGKVSKSGDTMTGSLIIKKATAGTNTYDDANPKLIFQNSNATQNVSFTFTDYDSVASPSSVTLNGNQGGEYFIAPNIKVTNGLYINSQSVAKAIKSITRSGTTFTATCLDGTTSTFTQQDNNTTYGVVSKTANGLCPKLPNETTTTKYLRQDGTWQTPPDNNTTYSAATQSAAGLMSAADKKKLDNLPSYDNASYNLIKTGTASFTCGGTFVLRSGIVIGSVWISITQSNLAADQLIGVIGSSSSAFLTSTPALYFCVQNGSGSRNGLLRLNSGKLYAATTLYNDTTYYGLLTFFNGI